MRWTLVRHTTPDIDKGICYGQADLDVGLTYQEEMNDVWQQIKDDQFDRVYSSPLKRCDRLARDLSNGQYDIHYDDRLKEMNFGEFEMKRWLDIHNSPKGRTWFKNYINQPVPGGESLLDLIVRTQDFIDDVQHDINKALVITHGGVIRAFYAILDKVGKDQLFDLQIPYGQVVRFKIE
jgi:alpha-ribazole phosphatase